MPLVIVGVGLKNSVSVPGEAHDIMRILLGAGATYYPAWNPAIRQIFHKPAARHLVSRSIHHPYLTLDYVDHNMKIDINCEQSFRPPIIRG